MCAALADNQLTGMLGIVGVGVRVGVVASTATVWLVTKAALGLIQTGARDATKNCAQTCRLCSYHLAEMH